MGLHLERRVLVKKLLNSHRYYVTPHYNLANPKIIFSISNQHLLLFCSCPCPYVLSVVSISCLRVNILSSVVHVFHNFYWKICLLFGQILFTCLNFSPALCLLFSYYKKDVLWMNCNDVDTPIALEFNTMSLMFIRIAIWSWSQTLFGINLIVEQLGSSMYKVLSKRHTIIVCHTFSR